MKNIKKKLAEIKNKRNAVQVKPGRLYATLWHCRRPMRQVKVYCYVSNKIRRVADHCICTNPLCTFSFPIIKPD
ncbi:hypothetical protein COX27_01810 [Candidatus Kuenenbacteria bacterium CG23_combo_of_CG06-09_8_20_14_all_36_9]|nr:MAG: hypothetical protein COX27_01810 [Candidatus Kuenenbacteria bacterium CG23_combo_of_CG06-09_8_20_14_all_36_9]